jgi:hypothetical protein
LIATSNDEQPGARREFLNRGGRPFFSRRMPLPRRFLQSTMDAMPSRRQRREAAQKSSESAAPPPPSAARVPRGLNLLLALTTLVGAWLLFQVQPMVAKRILPWFGGGASVWTTAMLFFQSSLFAGYLYVHLASRALAPARLIAVHTTLVAVAAALALFVGVIPADTWKPLAESAPVARILLTLAAFVGLPYLVLSATAPLTQLWFARTNPGRTPYRLYALSNLGSLGALISYPLLIEPRLGVLRQGFVWSSLYAVFAALCIASALLTRRYTSAFGEPALTDGQPTGEPSTEAGARFPARLQAFLWLALPACACIALLAVTTFLCQDVASIPLLWIAPMIVYLLSFILTFESDRWYRRWFWGPMLALATYWSFYVWQHAVDLSLTIQITSQLLLLLSMAMICHGELVRLRPSADRLTAYYLSISGGGALGGAFVAILAPLVFSDYYEFPLVILVVWILAFVILVTDRTSPFYDGRNFAGLLAMGVLFVGVVIGVAYFVAGREARTIAHARNFYGSLHVREYISEDPPVAYRQLANGRISHGAEFLDPKIRRMPSQYFGPASGAGLLLPDDGSPPRRVGIIGLGVGTLAAYALKGDDYRFYDINPQVVDFAETYFHFLGDARERGANVSIVLGDARLQLEREPPQRFDVLVIDAFTSDSIPSHLLTLEAFDVYLRHLVDPDGVIAVHISNRYLNLAIPVNAAARRRGLETRLVYSLHDGTAIGSEAAWVLVFRPGAATAKRDIGMRLAKTGPQLPDVLWTDDYTNIIGVRIVENLDPAADL